MNKSDIKIGKSIENIEGNIAYVDKILKDGRIRIYMNGKREYLLEESLQYWKPMNPIRNGRIVSDITFAVRFKQFLKWIPKDWWMSQCHYFEEYEYMMMVAEDLLEHQINTVTDENEIKYFENLNLL